VSSPAELLRRIEARDSTLWPRGNVSRERLGWLDVAARMQAESPALREFATGVLAEARRVVLIGMGGSSLGPEVLRAAERRENLVVLDTTDPLTVSRVPTEDTLFLVSSKSGATLEVSALLAYFWERVPDPSRYAAITDPGTELAKLAAGRGFARVFENPSDIGGRYSVLSYFGLVPAALLGYDVHALCAAAATVSRIEAVQLGVLMAEAQHQGRDKVTIKLPPPYAEFGLWVEQLIAESTGKSRTGCIPVPTTQAEEGEDRFEVAVHLGRPVELGAEFLRWELATAAAGHVLGIDPFNEPNVAESKANTSRVLASLPLPALPAVTPGEVRRWLREQVQPGDYVSLQAYLPYGPANTAALEGLRRGLRDALGGVAVTAAFGPRFLHSTGQLHKGGPNKVVAVQIVPRRPTAVVEIPGFGYDFATLIAAQSAGDHESLLAHGRRVLRVEVDDLSELAVV